MRFDLLRRPQPGGGGGGQADLHRGGRPLALFGMTALAGAVSAAQPALLPPPARGAEVMLERLAATAKGKDRGHSQRQRRKHDHRHGHTGGGSNGGGSDCAPLCDDSRRATAAPPLSDGEEDPSPPTSHRTGCPFGMALAHTLHYGAFALCDQDLARAAIEQARFHTSPTSAHKQGTSRDSTA